jgi:lipoprotein-releasing system permease protein
LTVSDLFQWIEGLTGSQLLSADVYPIDFLPSELRWQDMLMVSGGVIVLCLLASLYPARRAAGVHAAEALRHD